ncbi:hypothetical protein McanMca71_003345 [Microsporum canis]
MARRLQTTRRNEPTVSTVGSSGWRSLDNELTGYDAGEGTASIGQKLADGFERDYAIDISSLLTPNPPKSFRQSSISISADQAKNKRSGSRTEGLPASAQGIKLKGIPQNSREKPKFFKDNAPRCLKSKGNQEINLHSLHPLQPIPELDVTAELRKLWDEPRTRPTAPPVLWDDSRYFHIGESSNRARVGSAADAPTAISNSSVGLCGSGRFRTNSKHRGRLSDNSKGLKLHPSPPPSPAPSDVLYDDGMSSIINTTTAVFPDITHGSQRVSTLNPSLPLSPAPSDDLRSDGVSCPDSPALFCSASHKFSLRTRGRPLNDSRTTPQLPVQLLETATTTLASMDNEWTSQKQRFMPRQRPPLRDLSSNGLRTRNALHKHAQIRSTSNSSSHKENFHPHKMPQLHFEHGPQSGRNNIPRNRSDIYISFSDAPVGKNRASMNLGSDNDTGRLKKQTTRFSQNKVASSKEFLPSADASPKIDIELQVTSSTVQHSPDAGFVSSAASGSDAGVDSVDNKPRRPLSRSSRFSRPPACSASVSSFQDVDADPSLTALVEISSTKSVQESNLVKGPPADKRPNQELSGSLTLVLDLQTCLQRLEKENEALSRDIRRLGRENLALSDRVQALEAANSTTGARIGELSDENLSMSTILRTLHKATNATDEKAQTLIGGISGLCDKEITREQTCLTVDDSLKKLAGNPLKDDRTEMLDSGTVASHRRDTEKVVDPVATTSGESPLDDTLLTLIDESAIEDLRRKLEIAQRGSRCVKTCHIPSLCRSISIPPLSQALAEIGLGVEVSESDSPWVEDDPSTLPPVKRWVQRGQ